jgi:hypothetical protein
MLHFLRVYMPNHTNIIRSVSLIYHARTGSLPPRDRLQNVISNMDRESLMPALDLLAQLPNLQDFETILELRADRQIIIDRLTPRVRGGDPEVTKMLNAAKNAVTKSNIHDAVWTYWPASTERGPLPDNPEMSAGHSRRSHIKNCTQILNRFLDPILVRRNSLARIHDEITGEMWANGDYKTHLDLLDDADDVSDIIIALTECLTIYEEWKQESRHRKADPDRVQKLFDI